MENKDVTKCCVCQKPMGGTYQEMEERAGKAAMWFCSQACSEKHKKEEGRKTSNNESNQKYEYSFFLHPALGKKHLPGFYKLCKMIANYCWIEEFTEEEWNAYRADVEANNFEFQETSRKKYMPAETVCCY